MMRIAEGIDVAILAEDHWKWLKEKIEFDKTDLELQNLDSEKRDVSIQKNLALRKLLAPHFKDLEKIIKGDLDYLKTLNTDPFFSKFFFKPDKEVKEKELELDDATHQWQDQLKVVKELREKRKKDPKDPTIKASLKKEDGIRDLLNKKKEKIREEYNAKIKQERAKYLEFKRNTNIKVQIQNENEIEEKEFDLIDLLCYDKLNSGDKNWNANILREKLNVAVCPYCNRQYILGAKNIDGGWVTSAQLDHFLPKNFNPLLSCSFFNLIPSCYCCNHIKSDFDGEPLYPYKEGFNNDAKFYVDFEDGIDIKDLNLEDDVMVDIDTKSARPPQKDKIEMSIVIFRLRELYKMHQHEIKNLLHRIKSTRELRDREFADLYFGRGYDDLNPSEKKELTNFLLGLPILLSDEDFPLKKLKKDIIEQFFPGGCLK